MAEVNSILATYDHSSPLSTSSQPAGELAGKRLAWEYNMWGPQPQWVVEPCMLRIKETIATHLQQQSRASSIVEPSQDINLEFLAEGALNKTYTATLTTSELGQSCVVRVSLPVDPYHKTASEVAAIQYLRARTTIPIPKITAWDADEENPIGFEWILMEKFVGCPLKEVWYPEGAAGNVDWQTKERAIDVIAKAVAEMWRLRFPVCGGLYLTDSLNLPGRVEDDDLTCMSSERTSVTVGKIVSPDFFHPHLTEAERGPFHASYSWVESRLQFVIAGAEAMLQNSNDGDELEQAAFMKESADCLLRQLPNFIPTPKAYDDAPPESFALSHSDLSAQNILVDSSGCIVGIIDWECVNALPTWSACLIPKVLDSWATQTEKPLPELYTMEETGDLSVLYYEDLEAYEQTILRQLFLARMREIEPSWIEEYESQEGNRKRDFDVAVSWVGDYSGFHNHELKKWLDMLEAQGGRDAGAYYSLQNELDQSELDQSELDQSELDQSELDQSELIDQSELDQSELD